MADTPTSQSSAAPWVSPANRWLVAVTVMLTTVMEVLDTTIVNVALPHMQGNLGASVEEVSWVITSYLVSNAIMLPVTGWFSGLFGRKRFFTTCIVLFTLSSAACGAAPSLNTLVLFRILQGFSGAALIPLSQAILMETFPPAEQGMAMAIWGIGIMVAPIMGPTVGGWITDTYSWRWIFYINVPVGLITVFMAFMFIFDPPYIKRRISKIDYRGLLFLSLGVGSLQLVLDKGEREDWFSSRLITYFAVISVVSLITFFLVERRTQEPVVDLAILRNRTYTVGMLVMMMWGFGLYGAIVLLPLYLQHLMGYTAMQSGLALAPGGIASLVAMAIVGRLMNVIDPRIIMGVGTTISASAMFFQVAHFNLDTGFWTVATARFIHGFGLGSTFVPLSAVTLGVISKERMGMASGVFNLMRNIGGSVGIAIVTTLLSRRGQFHHHFLVSNLTPYNPIAQERLGTLSAYLSSRHGPVTGEMEATGLLAAQVQRHSSMMAFVDDFWLLGVTFILIIPCLILLGRYRPQRKPPAH